MLESEPLSQGMGHKTIGIFAGILAVGGALGGYAIHEHSSAQNLAAQNAQANATLTTTQHQLNDLTAKVNDLAARNQAQAAAASAPASQSTPGAAGRRTPAIRRDDPRFKKLQSQIDAQGNAIDQTRSDLTNTQGDLVNTRTELTGSIAHTHDELVLMQKKGERDFAEFDISKSKQFKKAGSLQIRLKKTNDKHQFADLDLMVNDRNLSQKHINLFQPVMFSTPDSPQPVEVVINDIGKDHIHGYVSAPKYRQSELASMSDAQANAAQNQNQGQPNPNDQPAPRQKLQLPQ